METANNPSTYYSRAWCLIIWKFPFLIEVAHLTRWRHLFQFTSTTGGSASNLTQMASLKKSDAGAFFIMFLVWSVEPTWVSRFCMEFSVSPLKMWKNLQTAECYSLFVSIWVTISLVLLITFSITLTHLNITYYDKCFPHIIDMLIWLFKSYNLTLHSCHKVKVNIHIFCQIDISSQIERLNEAQF